jgi:hypothetical protein
MGLKKTNIKYALASVAIVIGFGIIKVSISDVEIIRENIVSCIPEELSEMFDQEQAIICSKIQSQKTVLVAGVLLGGGLAVAGFIVAFVNFMMTLIRKTADQTNLRI